MRRCCLCLFFLFFALDVSAQSSVAPYSEKLTYRAYWSGIRVATVTLEAIPDETLERYTFQVTARTTPFADAFYSMRQTITSVTDKKIQKSFSYLQEGVEGKKIKNVHVFFDWNEGKARSFRNGKLKKTLAVPENTQDPLSVFYYFRSQRLQLGKQFICPVTDGKRVIPGHASVIREEMISTPRYGDVETYLVEPGLEGLRGVFNKSKNAKLEIWVAKYGSHLPIKIRSKVVVGSFSLELDEVCGEKDFFAPSSADELNSTAAAP